jgi:organic radical activating enzyme
MYNVVEIFRSVQGEGFWSGSAAVFVRFAGCNLSCDWCDTDHKQRHQFENAFNLAIAAQYRANTGDMVVLTGGEPMLQVDAELLAQLEKRFALVAIETNGTKPIPRIEAEKKPWVTVSPKDPMSWDSLPAIGDADEVKVVVPGNGWTVEHLRTMAEELVGHMELFLQPEDGARLEDAKKWMVEAVMADNRWRASVQMHKVLAVQ